MKMAQEQHVVENATEWVAPALLAASVAWSGFRLGLPFAVLALATLLVFACARFAMRKTDANRPSEIPAFETASVDSIAPELDELLLTIEDEILILDDPLIEPAADSRVVRLFARSEPTPGELVDRIEDFLGEGRRPPPDAQPSVEEHQMVDASAALHAALANIRASLR